ncbi:dihydrodipicolinate synthase family protein [Sphingobium sp. H39-3-25]|uniref:dihydrodipicolinate synthase family protein n=1 Tax=Sphingobium arseniciresistens TaxID=3030834 RepID=UPI0023B9214D|nr:dihydrodipicolinate synthase family protein [Sphingobium arseniciresistens]
MLTAQDIRGMYAIIATPAKKGAERLDAVDTVDTLATASLIQKLIRDGATGLIVLGTTGECATLDDGDYETFVSCVIETVGRRVPVFAGATAMGGHTIARRLRFLRDLKVEGTLLGLPMWQPLTTPMAVNFFRDVAELQPQLAVMIYANARAFRYTFPLEFWEQVSKAAPNVVAAKVSRAPELERMIAATEGHINFIPSEMVAHEFFRRSPDTTIACWATASGMNPAPAVALMNAIGQRDQAAIDRIVRAIGWANEPILPLVSNAELFASYNIQMEKTRINAAGYSECGPIRPPYLDFPEEHAEAARQCGRRWAQICEFYDGKLGFSAEPWATASISAETASA